MQLRLLVVLTALSLAIAAPVAAAADRTVIGTVIAPAAVQAGGGALPVLLSPAAGRRLGRPVLAAVIAGQRPVRWGSDRLRLRELRPGDRLTLVLRGQRVRRVNLRSSGRGDSFERLDRQLSRLSTAGQRTLTLAAPVQEARSEDASPEAVRALRAQLSVLESELESVGGDVETSLARLRAEQPHSAARRAAVVAAQAVYDARLTAVRDRARTAAAQTVVAAGALDSQAAGTGDVDGTAAPSDPGAPFGSTSAVSDLIRTLAELQAELGFAGAVPLT